MQLLRNIFSVGILLFIFGTIKAQVNVEYGSPFKYLKGNEASQLSSNWFKTSFDDSKWNSGNAPFHYGKGEGGTLLSDMRNNYTTLYLRTSFTAQSAEKIKKVTISANFDDGFVLWINGKEITRQNAPDALMSSALATAIHEYDVDFSLQLDSAEFMLVEGKNTLAVQLLNSAITSSDLFFDMGIEAQPRLPGLAIEGEAIHFSSPAGFYTSPFDLTLTSADLSCSIAYTIDGSNPSFSNTRNIAGTSTIVRIDPDIVEERGKAPAFIVKACLVKEGFAPTFPQAATYIFTSKVIAQSNPGGNWPEWFVNDQFIDYEMAADITTDSRYKSLMEPAFLDIPTISITTDLDNLFDESKGIYVNAFQKGEIWERECSVELINPDGGKGFMVNAGLRIRGGNSAKKGDNPKHAFRLFFREEYGESKLHYPFFGNDGADEFDCIDLRCEQNYSWSMDGDSHNTMVKDIFCRDMQGLMGQPHARGNQYHLYLNGMYWGIFQTDERPEASFAATYLGGDKDDYDVVKVNTQPWPYFDEVTDGTIDSWERVWNMCQNGFSTNGNYFAIEGKDATGERIDTATVWVDIDNLIDYMMIIFYSGNYDAPVSAWSSNDMPNNFFAIFNRENRTQGFKFIAHDSEHCMFVDKVNIGTGVDENRVNLGSTGKMKITRLLDFNPQWLHFKLSDNAEYRLRFADRAYHYLSEGGLLSPERAAQQFKKRVEEIDTAIIAESARWGDAKTWSSSLNKNDDWLPEIKNIDENFFPQRTGILIQQLIDENLYFSLNAPEILVSNEKVFSDNLHFSDAIDFTLKSGNSSGEIIYTLDGNDPRKVGGAVSTTALAGTNQLHLTLISTTSVMARIKNGNSWGPLKKVLFIKENEDYSTLKVTELAYHPSEMIIDADTLDDKSLEFIEFKNTGTETLDLSGLKLDSAVTYIFPENTVLNPGAFYVIASKPNSFFKRYGRYPNGNFQGQFSNSGEYVLLTDNTGNSVLSFTYSDKSPWPVEADGQGYSLTSVEENPTGDPDIYSYWTWSARKNGSPFTNDDESTDGNNMVSNSDNFNLQVYPNPTSGLINVEIADWNSTDETAISIFSMDGKKIFSKTIFDAETIDLKKYTDTKGIFILKAMNDQRIVTRKFVFIP